MATYKTSDFKKGLKVVINGEPWLMVEMNFRKPGKGNALYETRLKNLIRGTTLDRVYKGGDELEAADGHALDVCRGLPDAPQVRAVEVARPWTRTIGGPLPPSQ